MCSCFTKFYQGLVSFGNFLQPLFLLGVRLFWGWQFFKTGLEKFDDIHSIAGFFGNLNIPFPTISAYLAASTEMVGGLLLLLGLGSRLVAIPLIFTMIVALVTAHGEKTFQLFDDPVAFISQTAFSFLLASLTIFVFGPGPFSLDALIKRWSVKDQL